MNLVPIYRKSNLTVEEAAVYSGIGNQRMKLVFKGRRRTLLCQYVNSTEADIMPCFFVFIARIPESDYYSVVF